MYRGCLSDSSNDRLMCDQSVKYKLGFCATCSGSGCNDQPKLAKPKLSCVKCDDEKSCTYVQYANDAVPCNKNVLFGVVESCFTHYSNSKDFIYFRNFRIFTFYSRKSFNFILINVFLKIRQESSVDVP